MISKKTNVKVPKFSYVKMKNKEINDDINKDEIFLFSKMKKVIERWINIKNNKINFECFIVLK